MNLRSAFDCTNNCRFLMTAATLVQKFWNYCNILLDDGLSYGEIGRSRQGNF